jgi:hypothetical protein
VQEMPNLQGFLAFRRNMGRSKVASFETRPYGIRDGCWRSD